MKIDLKIPDVVRETLETLEDKGYLAYLVGGCVRDLLLGAEPKDWDITTNAKPEEIAAIFPKTVYENNFGTVTVIHEEIEDLKLRNIEITPFRLEAKYSDHRHPDEVRFSDKLEDDLKRRDFTINALAYDLKGQLFDLYGGVRDLKDKVVSTVGSPDERFTEDALRLLRAVRFASQLCFTINIATEEGIARNASLLRNISAERIRDELLKTLMTSQPDFGLSLSHKLGLLQYVLPELEQGIGIEQGGEHIYDVWEHTLRAVKHTANKDWPLEIRLAALLHDIGKPPSRRAGVGKSKQWTFYGHEVIGERMTRTILDRLKLSNKTKDLVEKLVRNHMFFSDPDKITMSAVRRIIANVGAEHIWDLMKVRAADRIGMGRPKEDPYRLRRYEAMIEEALSQPTSVAMLKIDGKKVIEVIRETPGPRICWILHGLLN
ncbi:MAG: HD domain-containing protein, partial [Candidatus Vogelbacteria bacterium]|nr:HD domain-containing protein [Candidatus Vogelbacteria bacterium]